LTLPHRGIWSTIELMDKGQVIQTLRAHRDELRAAGVVHLSIFGSVARGDASEQSDVDLIADFDKSRRLTLVKIGSLQHRLSELLGAEVELSSADWMREPVRSKALREAVLAF
jgi:predicted nucleotidyltransferase